MKFDSISIRSFKNENSESCEVVPKENMPSTTHVARMGFLSQTDRDTAVSILKSNKHFGWRIWPHHTNQIVTKTFFYPGNILNSFHIPLIVVLFCIVLFYVFVYRWIGRFNVQEK